MGGGGGGVVILGFDALTQYSNLYLGFAVFKLLAACKADDI